MNFLLSLFVSLKNTVLDAVINLNAMVFAFAIWVAGMLCITGVAHHFAGNTLTFWTLEGAPAAVFTFLLYKYNVEVITTVKGLVAKLK